ncbi:MAG: hypothetical protein ACRD0S_11015, partial [Acidimicrobiales bacterium]
GTLAAVVDEELAPAGLDVTVADGPVVDVGEEVATSDDVVDVDVAVSWPSSPPAATAAATAATPATARTTATIRREGRVAITPLGTLRMVPGLVRAPAR